MVTRIKMIKLFLKQLTGPVLTDGGGLQEETTALGIPCFTIRENTERPITLEKGTNTLVGITAKLGLGPRAMKKTPCAMRFAPC
jgi:UDP-N-acetylglucosamine 2-epimerase